MRENGRTEFRLQPVRGALQLRARLPAKAGTLYIANAKPSFNRQVHWQRSLRCAQDDTPFVPLSLGDTRCEKMWVMLRS